MESKVKSHISNKTYIAKLETIEDDDKDLKTELYMIPISGHKIMVAPGKSIMDDSGIAFCYVYVIQKERVVTKLGVYEKKTDSMPLIFDLSTFPEGAFCLFEEFEKNPSKLNDFEMSEKGTVFDFLISEFPKVENKRKVLKSAYTIIFEKLMKEENKQDKEMNRMMTPIMKIISSATKNKDKEAIITNEFLIKLKENALSDKMIFVYTLIALQFVFKIDFKFRTDNEKYQEIRQRWTIPDSNSTLEVDIDSYEIVAELEPEPDVKESDVKESDIERVDPDIKQEPETDEPPEPEIDLSEDQDKLRTKTMEPISMFEAPDTKLDQLTPTPVESVPKVVDLDSESATEYKSEPLEESKIPVKTRKTRTPKSKVELTDSKVSTKSESKAESKDESKAESKKESKRKSPKSKTKDVDLVTPLGSSMNGPKTAQKLKAPRISRLKTQKESKEDSA